MKISDKRMSTRSTQPPFQPAKTPKMAPKAQVPKAPKIPTHNETRAPNIILLNKSRPNESVPNKKSLDGDLKICSTEGFRPLSFHENEKPMRPTRINK